LPPSYRTNWRPQHSLATARERQQKGDWANGAYGSGPTGHLVRQESFKAGVGPAAVE
jgi:hypothetical protein